MRNHGIGALPNVNQGPGQKTARPRGAQDNPGQNSFAAHLEGAVEAVFAQRIEERLGTIQRQASFNINTKHKPTLEEQKKQLWDAALELESVFLNQLVSAMQRTIPRGDGVLSASKAEEIFQGMLDEEWAELMAKSGDSGLAKLLYDQLVISLEEG